MPRIRKKTSNRQNTRDRAKITKKVAEHKRKTKRAAKKDVTWKSKKKADPGVPSTFPYKDRVLAELAEEKRRNEEEKLARRAANKPRTDEPEDDTPGIASVANASVLTASASLRNGKDEVEDEEEEEPIPELVDTALATLQDVIDKADVVVQVLDARDIQGGRSGFVEKMVVDAGGKFALVVNKIDLVPRETLAGWLPHLPAETYLFSSKLPSDPSPSTFPGRTELLAAFARWSASRPAESEEDLTIALMGLPNVGKSSVLNALVPSSAVKQAVAPVYPTAAASKNPQPTTLKPVEVVLTAAQGVKVRVIDTPGWEHAEDDDEEDDEEMDEEKDWDAMQERVVSDLLRRNLGRIDRVKDVLPLAEYIVKRSDAQDLMLAYNVPYFTAGDVEAFLTALARANGRVRKHGDADLEGAARIVLRDWATGAFPYYVKHPSGASSSSSDRVDLTAVLSRCRTRKELRAVGKGLVRFQGGDIDSREVILDDDFIAMAGPESDSDDEDIESLELDDEDDEDDEDEDEEDDDEEEDEDALIVGIEDGEELDLADGPEPSSGSDLEDDEDEDDEEEEEERSPTPPPTKSTAGKRKRKSDVSVAAPSVAAKKAKRVSFGKNEVRVMKDLSSGKGKGGGGQKRRR